MSKPRITVIPNPHLVAQTQKYIEQLSLTEFLDNTILGDVVFWSGCSGTSPLWIVSCDCIGLLLNLRIRTSNMFQGGCGKSTVSCMDQTYELAAEFDNNNQIILTEEFQNPGASVIMKNDAFKAALHDALKSLLWLLPKLLPELRSKSYWNELVSLFPNS